MSSYQTRFSVLKVFRPFIVYVNPRSNKREAFVIVCQDQVPLPKAVGILRGKSDVTWNCRRKSLDVM